ncbi:GlcG protein [Pseudomonas syringae pv. primulae]|uniref:GlcG protein n=7 Tax=Pseudomonas syringae group TaxID=136849 RepID=A0A0P9XFE9_9PSED|nr:GlcG protein [Pseudomonas syringae pv. primulae]
MADPHGHHVSPAAAGYAQRQTARHDSPDRRPSGHSPGTSGVDAGRLRATGAVAQHQRGHRTRAGPSRHQRHAHQRSGLLRRSGLPPQCAGSRTGPCTAQHRRVVASHRRRRAQHRPDGQWLRGVRQGLRSFAAPRPGLRRESRASQCKGPGSGRSAARRTSGNAGHQNRHAAGIPLPVHLAACAKAGWRGRTGADSSRLQPDRCTGWPSVLRLGRHLLGHAAGPGPPVARQPHERAGKRQTSGDRYGKHRLPDASGERQSNAGAALDRADRSGTQRNPLNSSTPLFSGEHMKIKAVLTQNEVSQMLVAAREEAHTNGWAVAIAIVDDGGHLLAFERLDDASPISSYISIEKARTSALGKRESKGYEEMVNGGRTAFLSAPLLTSLEGGVPVIVDGQVIGAVGVSGVKADQDAQVAKAGVAALNAD